MEIVERYNKNNIDYSEQLFSHHRYISILDLCKDKKVLDIACGTGYGSEILSRVSKQVYGVDIDEKTIKNCKDIYKRNNLSFITGRLDKIPFFDNEIDIVISCESIEHVDEGQQKKFIKEVRRVLKNDGIFVLTTPNKKCTENFEVKNQFHIKELYPAEVKALLTNYFNYIDSYYIDLNICTHIFNQKIDKNEDSRLLKVIDYNLDNKNTMEPIYSMYICSNKKSEYKLSSTLYDLKKEFNSELFKNYEKNKELLEENYKLNRKIQLITQDLENIKKSNKEIMEKYKSLEKENKNSGKILNKLIKENDELREQVLYINK